MEDAATEFQVQGLELDWVCVAWCADFRFGHTDWSCHSFVSSKWQNMKKLDRRQYLRNAYRVLLTRAPGNGDLRAAGRCARRHAAAGVGIGIPVV